MKLQPKQVFRAVILFAFFSFIVKIHVTGEMTKYINPKYEILSQTAAVLFLFLFFVQLFRIWPKKHIHDEHCDHGCDHNHGESSSSLKKMLSYAILLFPLVTGFFLPVKTLDASIAAKKGVILSSAPSDSKEDNGNEDSVDIGNPSENKVDEQGGLNQEEILIDDQTPLPNLNQMMENEYQSKMNELKQTKVIHMADDVFEPYYEAISMEPEQYKGRTVKLNGFVYKEEGFQENQLVISRFLITHCVADASIIGFLTEFDQAQHVKENTWVEIEGMIDITTYNGSKLPKVKAASWKEISEPDEPYVYPVFTQLK
ncbi:TIGR03943 family putative permease subunit [Bacillus taeanensis]|uniref:TIGR03943 family protein n=1 Tax=Bacillus taeanensis TaxID=273032 RepID=A0A366XM29_9BACI|nr:TIGR03943 family protein [Bacillus taeanensis]RBW67420.1 TIGR03943 family protein [Bacillus taeanensis]